MNSKNKEIVQYQKTIQLSSYQTRVKQESRELWSPLSILVEGKAEVENSGRPMEEDLGFRSLGGREDLGFRSLGRPKSRTALAMENSVGDGGQGTGGSMEGREQEASMIMSDY